MYHVSCIINHKSCIMYYAVAGVVGSSNLGVGDAVVNNRSLPGKVLAVYREGGKVFYDIQYNDGRSDLHISADYVYPKPDRPVRTRKAKQKLFHYESDESDASQQYINEGDIDDRNVLMKKRRKP